MLKRNIFIKTGFILIIIFSLCSICQFPSQIYNKLPQIPQDEEVMILPDDFKFGVSTASYQIEGGNVNSNWWRFENTEGKIKNGDKTQYAIDALNRYEQDIDIMQQLSLNSYRFSVEWSRIEPRQGEFVEDEIRKYKDILIYLKSKNILPLVTLWHFSLPIWFEDMGGFEKKENINYYNQFCQFVAERLGDEIEYYVTMNEPMAYIANGYISAKWPPSKKSPKLSLIVLKNIITAHKNAYETIHKIDPDSKIGLSEHSSFVAASSKWNFLEQNAAMLIDYFWTHFIIDSVEKELDFIGVHYYYKQTIKTSMVYDFFSMSKQEFERKGMSRSYFPEGLYYVLMKFKSYKKPIFITEFGIPDYNPVSREQFIKEHLVSIYKAIKSDVDVKGAYYWTLVDCFEWNEGYDPKFGLLSVDLSTQKRTIKKSAYVYKEIAECKCIKK